jgi:hypothetical protein
MDKGWGLLLFFVGWSRAYVRRIRANFYCSVEGDEI